MIIEPAERAGHRRIPMWGKLYFVAAAITAIFVVSGHLGKTGERKAPTVGTSSPAAQVPAVPEQAAAKPKSVQDAASTYAGRIEAYWLPEVRALPDEPPSDGSDFGKLLTQIDGLVVNLGDGSKLLLSDRQLANWDRLAASVSAKQKVLLPAMRRRYGEMLDAKLFRRDIRVSVVGATLQVVGAPFVRNANVEDMQTELGPVLNRLRFRRVEYRWSAYLNDGVHYDLKPPADGVIATWNGAEFAVVHRPAEDDPNRKADPSCVPEKAAAIGLKC